MIKILLLLTLIFLLSRAYRKLLAGGAKRSKVDENPPGKKPFSTSDVSDAEYRDVK